MTREQSNYQLKSDDFDRLRPFHFIISGTSWQNAQIENIGPLAQKFCKNVVKGDKISNILEIIVEKERFELPLSHWGDCNMSGEFPNLENVSFQIELFPVVCSQEGGGAAFQLLCCCWAWN